MKYDLELIMNEQNALSIILKQICSNSLILEFGPANGRMTRYLKEMLECDVYIVEIDEEAASDAMQYAVDGLIGDIEQFEWLDKWTGIEFDFIIFADVLEHLHNPQEVLSKTKQLLKCDGKVFVSIPNIGHNSVMINLYRNIFNYTPLGLLDNTHIHFFSYNTLKDFCHYAGYFPVVEDATYSNVGENEIACTFDDIDKSIGYGLKKRDYGSVYQFVFTLQKEEYVKWNSYNTDYRIRKKMPIGEFKIYLDRGNGFCEENSITYHIYMNERLCKEIVLENSEEICSIRIDPLNMGGIFKFTQIKIADQEGDRNWTISECICGGENIGGYLFCDNDDPQVIMENIHLLGEARLTIEIEYVCAPAEEGIIKSCIDIMKKNERTKSVDELEHLNLREELNRCAFELDHRMDEINLRDQEIDRQNNELKLASEELERRAVELDHRMDEINLRDREIDQQNNDLRSASEELERRAVELNHRMSEINLRDKEIDRQHNELKLADEELERRAVELDYRMDQINELQGKINYVDSLNLRGIIKWYFNRGKK